MTVRISLHVDYFPEDIGGDAPFYGLLHRIELRFLRPFYK